MKALASVKSEHWDDDANRLVAALLAQSIDLSQANDTQKKDDPRLEQALWPMLSEQLASAFVDDVRAAFDSYYQWLGESRTPPLLRDDYLGIDSFAARKAFEWAVNTANKETAEATAHDKSAKLKAMLMIINDSTSDWEIRIWDGLNTSHVFAAPTGLRTYAFNPTTGLLHLFRGTFDVGPIPNDDKRGSSTPKYPVDLSKMPETLDTKPVF